MQVRSVQSQSAIKASSSVEMSETIGNYCCTESILTHLLIINLNT